MVLWHMPHGIILHLAPKNSNSYYLLWSCSTNLPASTTADSSCEYCPSQHHHIPSDWALFHTTSCASPANAGPLFTTSISLPSHFSTKSPQNQEASTSSCTKTALEISHKIFIAETSFWAAIALAILSTTAGASQHHNRGALHFSGFLSCYQVNSLQDLFNEDSNICSSISGHTETLVTILL